MRARTWPGARIGRRQAAGCGRRAAIGSRGRQEASPGRWNGDRHAVTRRESERVRKENRAMSRRWIARTLLRYAKTMDDWVEPVDGIRRFSLPRANSFVVGVLLDRLVDTQRAWAAADWIVESIYDNESPPRFWEPVIALETRRLNGFMRYGWGGKAFHRNWKTMARNLLKCAEIVVDKYDGDPRQIWNNERCISSVRKRFEELPGIGAALSRMAVLILARNYGLLGGKGALPKLDVKPDVLLKRVFKRTGLVPPIRRSKTSWKRLES